MTIGDTIVDAGTWEALMADIAAVDALREPDGTLAWRPTLRHTVAVA